MYKVFFNDRILFIGETDRPMASNDSTSVNLEDYETVSFLLNNFLQDQGPKNLHILVNNESQIWPFLHSKFKEIDASGGLVVNEKKELLAIRRLGFWDLPKGKIEKGETPEEAGIREVREETGISSLSLEKSIGESFHIYKSPYHKNRWVLKKTFWFLMSSNSKEDLVPQTKEDITEAIWVSKEKTADMINGTYPSLVFLFENFIDVYSKG